MTDVDFDAHYKVEGMEGVAWYLTGYAFDMREVEVMIENEYEGEDIEPTFYVDYEEVEDRDWVIAIMVGDDREHRIEVSTLIKIDDDDYCHQCGQIGCTHDGRERE